MDPSLKVFGLRIPTFDGQRRDRTRLYTSRFEMPLNIEM
jgi:hypothetical protein